MAGAVILSEFCSVLNRPAKARVQSEFGLRMELHSRESRLYDQLDFGSLSRLWGS